MENSQLLHDQVSAGLWQLDEDHLQEVCRYLKCNVSPGKPRRLLIKTVENNLEEFQENESETEVIQCFKDLLSFMIEVKQEVRGLEERYLSHSQRDEEGYGKAEKMIDSHKPFKKSNTRYEKRIEPSQKLTEVTLRREFKIWGQIGESGQKEKLSYPSLIRQMEVGLEKGHSETEIVEAVVRAVTPGLPLRDMLEIKRGLALQSLHTILKGHYKVDSTTALYNQLINVSQEPKESVQNFIFRAIELKEKLLWKAEDGDDDRYSRDIIQRKFLRSIETGLTSDSLKFQIQPYLSNIRTTDEELIEAVNEAAKLEGERQEKLKRLQAGKPPRIHEFHTDPRSEYSPSRAVQSAKEPGMAMAIRTVKGRESKECQKLIEELRAEMRQMITAAMEANNKTSVRYREERQRGCKKCREEHVGENCQHCFKCGQTGHFSRGCRVQSSQSGNDQGLLRRGHQ
ncbi:hypothetical protein PO909_001491 [Leuciscus waleckii]